LCGPNRLVIDLDDPTALDLDTGRLRYLLRPDAGTFESASPGGKVILCRTEPHGPILWADAR
jgi:hypothetical protein